MSLERISTGFQEGQFAFNWQVPESGMAIGTLQLTEVEWTPEPPADMPEVLRQACPREPVQIPIPDGGLTIGPLLFGLPGPQRVHTPLEVEDLHRKFADVPLTETGVVKFASRHGLLGGPLTQRLFRRDDPDPEGGVELVFAWYAEIFRMDRLVKLWDMVRWELKKELRSHIAWDRTDKGQIVRHVGTGFVIASEDDPAGSINLSRWKQGDRVAPARFLVHYQIMNALSDMKVAVLPRRKDWTVNPKSLLSAMYVNFAMEVIGRRGRMRECKHCGKRFTPRRRDNLYCEEACRKNYGYHKLKRSKLLTDGSGKEE